MFFNGKIVIIEKPRKMFGRKWLRRKGRFGRKFQLVVFFAGWCEMIEDGQILQYGESLIMNQKTWNNLERAIK